MKVEREDVQAAQPCWTFNSRQVGGRTVSDNRDAGGAGVCGTLPPCFTHGRMCRGPGGTSDGRPRRHRELITGSLHICQMKEPDLGSFQP